MKFLIPVFILAALVTGCGNHPEPGPGPTPGPAETSFEVVGLKISVKGEMKSKAKASLPEVKASIMTAVKQLEN